MCCCPCEIRRGANPFKLFAFLSMPSHNKHSNMTPTSASLHRSPSSNQTPHHRHLNVHKYLDTYTALSRLMSSSPQAKPPPRQLAMSLAQQLVGSVGAVLQELWMGDPFAAQPDERKQNTRSGTAGNSNSTQVSASNSTTSASENYQHDEESPSSTATSPVTLNDSTNTASATDSNTTSSTPPNVISWPHLKRLTMDILLIVKSHMKEANVMKRRNMLWILVALCLAFHIRQSYDSSTAVGSNTTATTNNSGTSSSRKSESTAQDSKRHTSSLTHQSSLSHSPLPEHDFTPEMSRITRFLATMFADRDAKVRFYACEAMYNVCNIFRGFVLHFFAPIFEGSCRLAGDTDHSVRNANIFLTRVLKDIVAEDYQFNVEAFIPLIEERVQSNNAYIRQFLLEWVLLLNSIPDIQIIEYLPSFLSGIFEMCSDSNKQIVIQAENALEQFLSDLNKLHRIEVLKREQRGETNHKDEPTEDDHAQTLQRSNSTELAQLLPSDHADFSTLSMDQIDFDSIIDIVMRHCVSHDQFIRLTALQWIRSLLDIAHDRILAQYNADILNVVLPSIGHKEEKIRRAASSANQKLQILIHYEADASDVKFDELLDMVKSELTINSFPSRVCALNWIRTLLDKDFDKVIEHIDDLFVHLLRALKDSPQEVVYLVLDVLASMASSQDNFSALIYHLLDQFCVDKKLMSKAGFLIREISAMLDTEKLYREISVTLRKKPFGEDRREFCSLMVQTLNMILLTSQELSQVRNFIRGGEKRSLEDQPKVDTVNDSKETSSEEQEEDLFITLYKTWSFNPVSTLSLCLLAKKYRHASLLVQSFSQLEMTVNFLVHVDNLVQLLESPVFVELRLQLLEPQKHPYLVKTLYGILMILPQSSAYTKLNQRLQSISAMYFIANNTHALLEASTPRGGSGGSPSFSASDNVLPLDEENQEYKELLEWFKANRL